MMRHIPVAVLVLKIHKWILIFEWRLTLFLEILIFLGLNFLLFHVLYRLDLAFSQFVYFFNELKFVSDLYFKSLFQLFYLGSQNSEKFILRAFLNHFFLGSLKFLVLLFLLLSKFKLKLERKLVYFGSHKFMVLKCTRRSMGHCSKVILPLHFSCFFNNFWT